MNHRWPADELLENTAIDNFFIFFIAPEELSHRLPPIKGGNTSS